MGKGGKLWGEEIHGQNQENKKHCTKHGKLHEVRSCMEPQNEGDWQLFWVSSICE